MCLTRVLPYKFNSLYLLVIMSYCLRPSLNWLLFAGSILMKADPVSSALFGLIECFIRMMDKLSNLLADSIWPCIYRGL